MQAITRLEPGHFYHIYNRGINQGNTFLEDRNYAYFLQLYAKYIAPVADTFAYCLLRNHFHLLVRIRTHRADGPSLADRVGPSDELPPLESRAVSQAFSNWLNAYTKAINKAYKRTGNLFQHRFSRLPVTSDRHFTALVRYIHHNPQKHGFVSDFRDWPYSSYQAMLSDRPTRIERAVVLDWFGGARALKKAHLTPSDESAIRALVADDKL